VPWPEPRIAARESQRGHAAETLKHAFGGQAFRGDFGDVVLDDLVAAASTAHNLAQVVVLIDGHLLEARDKDIVGLLKSLTQLFVIFFLVVPVLH